MSRQPTRELRQFLSSFNGDVSKKIIWLREFVWDLYPSANELIYDNYNALAIGWSLTDRLGHTFCSIAAMRTGNIHFGFYRGNELNDLLHLLRGEGKQYRYLLVNELKDFPRTYISQLMQQAYAYALARVKDKSQIKKGLTITKSISPRKRAAKRSE